MYYVTCRTYFNAFAWKIFFRRKLEKILWFSAVSIFSKTFSNFFYLWFFWNFFAIRLLCYLSHLISVHSFQIKKISRQISKSVMIFNLFSFSVYSAVSVLSTNKLVQNLSICNPSVIFVSNHCYPTLFMYSHFLVLRLSSISNQSINLQSINFQFFFVCFLSTPSFIGFYAHLFVLAFNPFML